MITRKLGSAASSQEPIEKPPSNEKRARPLITIGITCFNAADTIERCINSALSQTWPDLEIIIVDDKSSDGSQQKIAGLVEMDPRVRLICHEQNFGTAVARTRLVREARGEFLAFFDDDDEALPERVATQAAAVIAHEEEFGGALIACYASRLVIKPNGRESYSKSIGTRKPYPFGETVAVHILTGEPVKNYSMGMTGSCTLFARLSTFHAVGDFDSQFRRCQDLDWAVRLALLGGHFVGCPQALTHQYVTATEDKAQTKPLEYSLLLKKKYRTFLSSRGLYRTAVVRSYVQFFYARGYRLRFRAAVMVLFLLRPRTVVRQWKTARAKSLRLATGASPQSGRVVRSRSGS
jgi:glycosyltransferase involved in cell wall biosynthesis